LTLRFQQLSKEFNSFFNKKHFPDRPETLYGAASYMIEEGGKRIRPVLCLMGNELFGSIHPDTWQIASALELFHNFTLIHDDIMDKAPLRRGKPTVHARYNESTALLAGDVMLLRSYEYLNDADPRYVRELIRLLNKTGREVCEGQQLDMDFENAVFITKEQYLYMIELKTAVFLAASLQMGAIIGGANEEDQKNIYAFGKNLGLAFQVQDDWLDSFGNPSTFGKQRGGDILANKKTFLLVHALENAGREEIQNIQLLMHTDMPDKIVRMIEIFRSTGADQAAEEAKKKYMEKAEANLEMIGVPVDQKIALRELAQYLMERKI
jgi:geranylgeranyl diphosphate synthase, type II